MLTSRVNGHSIWSFVMYVGLIIFMIFGVFLPAGCSSGCSPEDNIMPSGGKTPISNLPDVACSDDRARLTDACMLNTDDDSTPDLPNVACSDDRARLTDACILNADDNVILDLPDVDCPNHRTRFPDASKKNTDTCVINTMLDTDGDGMKDFEEDDDDDNDGVLDEVDVDADGDGLIEIDSLTMLHNIRYNLIGTSYKTSAGDVGAGDNGDNMSCGSIETTGLLTGITLCNGYELIRNLNFDRDRDGTWNGGNRSLDSSDNVDPYFLVVGGKGGWKPIGEATLDNDGDLICSNANTCFNAIFEGNGLKITGLAIRRAKQFIGMFGAIGAKAKIRNIGLVDSLAVCTRTSNTNYIGGLVGYQNAGSITVSYTIGGAADGGDKKRDSVGGLVGYQNAGSITSSYATGSVDGGDENRDSVGGLVGTQGASGSITASYARGAVNGGPDRTNKRNGDAMDHVGGLVGQSYGSITSSYATGDVDGGDGITDSVGGLVGIQRVSGSITASYATGAVDGGAKADRVGVLVGRRSSTDTTFGEIIASYGFGTIINDAMNTETPNSLGAPPENINAATALTEANTPDSWGDSDATIPDIWDFGTNSQIPALKYADYDGTTDNKYYCDNVAAPTPTTGMPMPIPIPNCGTLIPGQGRVE